MILKPNMTLLFIGDSITDAGRSRTTPLGNGFVYMTAAWMMAQYAEFNLTFVNRGVSGDRSADLVRRWKKDCLEPRPDLVTIMVGVNDTWRRFDRNDPTPIDTYRDNLQEILRMTRDELHDPQVVLMEPFLLPWPQDRRAWREDLEARVSVVHELAVQARTELIALDFIFSQALQRAPADYWTEDGVHPTMAGHGLIARSWIDCVSV